MATILEKSPNSALKYPGNYAFGRQVYDTRIAFVTFLGTKEFKVLTSGFNKNILEDHRQKQQTDKSKSLIMMYMAKYLTEQASEV